jgi:hypothetical protein
MWQASENTARENNKLFGAITRILNIMIEIQMDTRYSSFNKGKIVIDLSILPGRQIYYN